MMLQQRPKPSHDPGKFEEYISYKKQEGEGFILVQDSEYEEVYIFDDYGGWVDTELNYYNKSGQPSGWFDQDHNFYDMRGQRIPGGYKGGRSVEKRINEIKRYVEKVQNSDQAKFVIEFSNLPVNTKADQIAQYIMERCNVIAEMLDECKKLTKDANKGFVVVRGGALVLKIITAEGRRFRIREKDGTYSSGEIQVFVKLSKFNNPIATENNIIITASLQDDPADFQGYKILFEGLDSQKSDAEFREWLARLADFQTTHVKITRKKDTGLIELDNENLKFRILKMNGRKFGEGTITFKTIK